MRKPPLRPNPRHKNDLPPHSIEAEKGALGCIFLAAEKENNRVEVETLMSKLRPHLFYDLRHQNTHNELATMLSEGNHALSLPMFVSWLQAHKKKLEDFGGLDYLSQLPQVVGGLFQFGEFRNILEQMHRRRFLIREGERMKGMANDPEISLDDIKQRFDELSERTATSKKPVLKIWRANELLKYKPPTHLRLVGDNEVCMGYDGVTLVAGPGSSGKSLAVASLALAGAIGKGTWMGREVHRSFKTLILQAENGAVRIKNEVEAMAKQHPKVDIENHIFISEPPEGGLPFHNAEFRSAIRREIELLKPDLVVLDPWSQVAAEDAAKEVVDKLVEIRSCFPSGENCPGLLIVAHTKKPRPEDVRRGRGLTYLVSGSIALTNSARCVYVLLPWSDEFEDDRIYWATPKLNNGQMYAPSVWKRRFGTFFEADPNTDPKEWGEEKKEEARAITPQDLVTAFGSESVLTKTALAKRLEAKLGIGYSTVMHALTPGPRGYLAQYVSKTNEGWLQLVK